MPEPIVLAPKGMDAANVMTGEVNWQRLASLPPFQNYVSEQVRDDPELSNIKDYLVQAQNFIQRVFDNGRQGWLIDDYSAWHSDQGKWPNETPMGELRN